jgi:DNA-binding beta-propeller fold protein YncE
MIRNRCSIFAAVIRSLPNIRDSEFRVSGILNALCQSLSSGFRQALGFLCLPIQVARQGRSYRFRGRRFSLFPPSTLHTKRFSRFLIIYSGKELAFVFLAEREDIPTQFLPGKLERTKMMIRKTALFIALFVAFTILLSNFNLPSHKALAQSDTAFGPETFVRGSGDGKPKFTRTFNASNTLIPYTLTANNGESNGSQFVKKAIITLNGQEVGTLTKAAKTLVLAVRLQSQNNLQVVLKGPNPDSFVKITIEPTRANILNSPDDGDFDSKQAGIGFPSGVSVDSASHHAFLSDASDDSVFEFDMNDARVNRRFNNVDGDSIAGSSGTSGVCINTSSRNIVAANPADVSGRSGTLSVINMDNGSVRTFNQGNLRPFSVAGNGNTNAAAFTALFNPNDKRAYFLDIATGNVTTRDESLTLLAVTDNSMTNEFIFTGSDGNNRTALLVYEARSPFRRVKEIPSSAKGNTVFDKIAVNPANNLAVALNLRDGAVYVFDIAAGQEVARIPIRLVKTDYAEGDIAVNPETNMAIVVNRSLNILYVIDLATFVLRAELLLPNGINPLAVGVDTQLNRAAIAESGFSSSSHNGSVILVQLPSR